MGYRAAYAQPLAVKACALQVLASAAQVSEDRTRFFCAWDWLGIRGGLDQPMADCEDKITQAELYSSAQKAEHE